MNLWSNNRQILTDLQQKVTYLQTNINNQKASGLGQKVVSPNLDGTILNEVRETIRLIKSETNTLLQKSVGKEIKRLFFFNKEWFFTSSVKSSNMSNSNRRK